MGLVGVAGVARVACFVGIAGVARVAGLECFAGSTCLSGRAGVAGLVDGRLLLPLLPASKQTQPAFPMPTLYKNDDKL